MKKVLKILSLAIPLPLYLFLQATIFDIKPNVEIYDIKINEVISVFNEERTFIYSDNKTAKYSGLIEYNAELNTYGVYIDKTDIVKVGWGYYSVDENGAMVDVKKFTLQKQTGYKIPFVVVITIGTMFIVYMLWKGHLKWHKKHPKQALLVSLGIGWLVLLGIDKVVGGMVGVFFVSFISWGMYLLIDALDKNKVEKDKGSQLLDELRRLV